MKKYRYPGAPPFSFEDRKLFYGRDDDINRFYKFVSIEPLVVLYSRSGLGKSSMLNAGFVPKLVDESNFQPFSVKFSSSDEESTISPVEIVVNEIKQAGDHKSFLNKIAEPDGSLWYHLKSNQIATKGEKDYFLIFDQFENLFNFPKKEEIAFGKQMADLLNVTVPQKYRDVLGKKFSEDPDFLSRDEMKLLFKPLNVHIVIAIRSDKMALLNRLKISLPNILNRTFQLEALNSSQAKDAITSPAQIKSGDFISPEFSYSEDALEEMLKYLSKNGGKKIESFQLQIICRYIEENIIVGKNKNHVEADDLGKISTIFENYYDSIIEKLPEDEQLKARILVEEGLIFEDEMRRMNLYEGHIFKKYEISEDTLQELVNKRLLRREPDISGDGFSYELSHDTLVAPILKAKAKRKRAEKAEAARLAEEERKKIEKEAAAKRRNRRRIVGSVVLLFLVLAISWGIHSYFLIEDIEQKKVDLETAQIELNDKYVELSKKDAINRELLIDNRKQNSSLREQETKLKKNYAELAENRNQLSAKNAELQRTSDSLTVKEQEAREAKQLADSNQKIAQESLKQYNTKVATDFLSKADQQMEEKNYNAAKLYTLNAKKWGDSLLSPEEIAEADGILQEADYPLSPFRTEYTLKMQSIAFSPDEQYIASCGNGYQTIILWDAYNGKEIKVLTGHKNDVNCVDFSPDSNFIASGSDDGTIRIWDIATGKTVNVLDNYGGKVLNVQYSPEDNLLAGLVSHTYNTSIYIWDLDSKKIIIKIKNISPGMKNMVFSNSSDYLAYVDSDNSINFWNTKKKKTDRKLEVKHSDRINCLSFSNDDKLLASGSNDNTIVIWDLENSHKSRLEEHSADVTSLQFGPTDYLLASGDYNSTIKLWQIDRVLLLYQASKSIDTEENKSEAKKITSYATLENHRNQIVTFEFISSGNKLASLGKNERSVKFWNISKDLNIAQRDTTNPSIPDRISEAEKNYNLKMVGSDLVINSSDINSLYSKAETTKDNQQQAALYRKILKDNPNEINAFYGLAYASLLIGENGEAVKYFRKYLERMSTDYKSWNFLGNAYYRQGLWERAISCYDSSIKIKPDYALSRVNKGLVLDKNGKPKESIASFRKAIEINPNVTDVYNYLGNVYFKQGDYNEAINNYQTELKNNQSNKVAFYNLGMAYYRIGDEKRSIDNYKEALKIDSEYVDAHINLGKVYYMQKNHKESFSSFINSLEINPENATSWYYLGLLSIEGDPIKGIAHLNQASKLDPSHEEIDLFLILEAKGSAYSRNADYDSAIFYYKKALKLNDSSAIINQNIAMALAHSNRDRENESESYYLRAQALSTKAKMNEIDYDVRGFSYLAVNDSKKAFDDLKNAEKINPEYDKVYRSLACYYSLNNQIDKAVENLNLAFELEYHDFIWIQHEPSLNNIRGDSHYQLLIADLETEKQKDEKWQEIEYQKYELIANSSEYAAKGNYNQAVSYYETAIELYPEDERIKTSYAEILSKQGNDYFLNKDYDAAFESYEKLWKVDRYYFSEEDWNNLGNKFYTKANSMAKEFYLHAIALNKNYKWALRNLGLTYMSLGETDNAISAYKKALIADSKSADIYNRLGVIYKDRKKNADSAINYFKGAVGVDPDYRWSWANLGDVYRNKKERDSAIYAYEKALKLYPEFTYVLNGLGLTHYLNNEDEEAIGYFEKAVKIDPAYKWAWRNMGYAYRAKGDTAESIFSFKKALAVDSAYSSPLGRLASLYNSLGRYDSALYFSEKLVTYYPDNSEYWGNRSWFFLFAGQYDKALQASITGYNLNNDNKWILTNKGHAILFLGRVDEAKDLYLEIKDFTNNSGRKLKESLLNDFDAFEKAGITNENFDAIRELLKE